MILAAGLGTRLRPLTEETPKSLILINGRPVIHYQIALLKKFGITDIAINLHHLGELIEKELGNGSQLGVTITYSYEEKILGTGGGLKKMKPFFAGEDFWVFNSDVLIDANLETIHTAHQRKGAKATMILRPHPVLEGDKNSPTALFVDDDFRIVSFAENKQTEARRHEKPYMFTGIHIMHPSFLDDLPEGFSCIFQNAYRPAIERGAEIYGTFYEGYWRDVGTMETYRQADQEISEGRVKLSYL